MQYDPNRHHRRSIRLKGFDYRSPGAYFITLVTQGRARLFGRIVGGQMLLNSAGRMIEAVWKQLPRRFPTVEVDAFVVMPDHVHGILILKDPADIVRAGLVLAPCSPLAAGPPGAAPPVTVRAGLVPALVEPPALVELSASSRASGPPAAGGGAAPRAACAPGETPAARWATVGDVVGAYKSLTTLRYVRGVKAREWPPFAKRVWLRNYYESVIRNDAALQRVRAYIHANPQRWGFPRHRADKVTGRRS